MIKLLNVLLVEDELIVRKGLRALINWDDYDMEITSEATNGEQALNIIYEKPIDIVITDIRMPMMNGIELTRKVKEEFPQIKVMLLTCYDDFEYVQEALELGASCYLLKTDLEDGSLEKQLLKVSNKIKSERENRKTYEELEIKAKQTSLFYYESQMRKVLQGNAASSIIEDELNWLYSPHMFIKIIVKEKIVSIERFKNAINTLMKRNFIVFQMDSQSIIIVMELSKRANEQTLVAWRGYELKQLQAKVESVLNGEYNIYYFICETIDSLYNKYEQLRLNARKHLFYYGFGHSIRLESLYDKQGVAFYSVPIERLKEWTVLRDWPRVKELCSFVFQFYEKNKTDEEIVKINVATMIETIMQGLQSNSYLFQSNWGSNSLDFKERVKEIDQFNDLVNWFYKGLDQLEENRVLFIGGVNQIVNHAIAYIEANYSNNLTLDRLSKEVGLSKSYLSTMFKKETGKNIVEFINDIRIKKAKQLFHQSDLRVFEIAEKVGYKDPKYFSRQFKRIAGVSPNDYKNQIHEFV